MANYTTEDYKALRWAVRHGELDTFKKALIQQRAQFDDFDIDTEVGPNRRTLLHLTTYCYDETVDNMVKILTDEEAYLEAEDEFGASPLDLACETQNFRCAIALIENGAYISKELLCICVSRLKTKSRNGLVPDKLLEEFSHQQRRLISIIIHRNPKALWHRDATDGYTPLMLAACNGETHTVKLLLESTEVDSRGRDNRTALMCAVEGKNAESVELLISAGADVNLTDVEGQSAAHLLPAETIDQQWKRIWVLLLERGCDLESRCWRPDIGTVSFLQLAVYQALKRNDVLLDLIVNHGKAVGLQGIREVSQALENADYDPQCFLRQISNKLLYGGERSHVVQRPVNYALQRLQQKILEHLVSH